MVLPFLFLSVAMIDVAAAQTQGTAPSTAAQFRRTYLGGKDDSDLTVQNLRTITRKGDMEAEDFSSVEPSEQDTNTPTAPATGQGFGE